MKRHLTWSDRFCLGVDQMVRALSHTTKTTGKKSPAHHTEEPILSEQDRKHSAALMRINHAGEICAQALYHGQGVVTRNADVQDKMQHAALEEGDHLAWCQERLVQLGSHASYLNSIWYAGSFCIGVIAGMAGDRYSLGFVAETERQVIKHLDKHLSLLPADDHKSREILRQMEMDEAKHRDDAIHYGAAELPMPVKAVMSLTSKVMVNTAYYL